MEALLLEYVRLMADKNSWHCDQGHGYEWAYPECRWENKDHVAIAQELIKELDD